MKLVLLVGLLVLCISATAQVVYKTVHADGRVVYSDIPSEGAKPVNLSAVNSVVVPAINTASKQTPALRSQNKNQPVVQYLVSIVSPRPEQSLRDNAGQVNVQVEVAPKKSGKFQLILDNQIVNTQTKGQFLLEGVDRGAHVLEVNFLDNSGKILASSIPQTFYLHKASALINAN